VYRVLVGFTTAPYESATDRLPRIVITSTPIAREFANVNVSDKSIDRYFWSGDRNLRIWKISGSIGGWAVPSRGDGFMLVSGRYNRDNDGQGTPDFRDWSVVFVVVMMRFFQQWLKVK
jgi:hypothetical protein